MADHPSNDATLPRVALAERSPSQGGVIQVSLGSLEDKFDKLLLLMENQIKLTEMTFKEHGEKLETLRKDALKNDQPFEPRKLEDQQTWGGLNKEAVARTKEAVGEWKDLMGVSLIFNAIFLAIVTAFIVPVLQAFQSSASSNTNDESGGTGQNSTALALIDPHRQAVIQQWIAFFQISSFALSIFNSALCVLGTQWGARLIVRIRAKDYYEMTIQHKRREAVGKRWLLRLMGVLFSTLLLSILLFMTAFLLQAWVVAYSQPTPQPVLIAAAVIVAGLVLAIMIIIIATTFHAVKWENSPFETPLSSLLRRLLPDLSEEEDDEDGDEEDVGDLLEVKKDDDEDVETLKVYAGVVLNATEPETLEYAVPSYRWNDWLLFKDDLLPLFEAVYERFMASDTSIRVKETVIQHLIEFRKGTIFFHHEGQENKVADWCWSTCQDLCTQSHDLHARLFPLQILFTLELPNNENFRDLLQAPYVECMNRVLASYDLDGNLGEREDIFSSAVIECSSLLSDKKEDLVTQILSTRPFSILKSLIKSSMEIHDMKELVSFIVEGPEITLLNEMSELVSNPPEGRAIKILAFLDVLTRSPPPDLTVPDHFDLSRSLFGLTRSDLGSSDWINYSKVLIYLFDHGAFDRLTDPCAALPFLKWLCTRSGEEAERATFYLNNYATRFTEATELLPGDRRSLITDLSTFAHDLEADAGGNATTIFVKAFDRCNALLLSDHPLDLSREESVLILRSVLRNPILDWNNIRHFMRRVPRDHEMGWEVIIQALNQGKVPYVGWFLSPMSFFCSLLEERGFIRFIDSDIDISPLLAHLTSHKPHIGSWTRYSNALISCIDRGNVFERITDRASARKFFELCLNKDYETFEDDRESAKYYLKQLDRQDILARTSRRPHLLARACNNLTKRLGIASKVKSTELATAEAHMSLEMEEPPSVLPDISDPDREDTATSNPQS